MVVTTTDHGTERSLTMVNTMQRLALDLHYRFFGADRVFPQVQYGGFLSQFAVSIRGVGISPGSSP